MRITDIRKISTIPANDTNLALRCDRSNYPSGTELIQALPQIPHTVTSLDLRLNNLRRLGAANLARRDAPRRPVIDLIQVLQSIPHTVISLDLRLNNLQLLSGQYRQELIDLLLQLGTEIQIEEPLNTEFRQAKLKQYGRFFDEARSGLHPELVNEILEFNYPKSPSP